MRWKGRAVRTFTFGKSDTSYRRINLPIQLRYFFGAMFSTFACGKSQPAAVRYFFGAMFSTFACGKSQPAAVRYFFGAMFSTFAYGKSQPAAVRYFFGAKRGTLRSMVERSVSACIDPSVSPSDCHLHCSGRSYSPSRKACFAAGKVLNLL